MSYVSCQCYVVLLYVMCVLSMLCSTVLCHMCPVNVMQYCFMSYVYCQCYAVLFYVMCVLSMLCSIVLCHMCPVNVM